VWAVATGISTQFQHGLAFAIPRGASTSRPALSPRVHGIGVKSAAYDDFMPNPIEPGSGLTLFDIFYMIHDEFGKLTEMNQDHRVLPLDELLLSSGRCGRVV
jgi:hypothetical protein